MVKSIKTIPIIDIFAGPGGLSEGFNSVTQTDTAVKFESVLAIEKDPVACETLRLRSFYHQFARKSVPSAYYKVLRGELPVSELSIFPEWNRAVDLVWNAELGKVSVTELHSRIDEKLKDDRNWVLLGGPPCQAYSLIGRARMTGVGHDARAEQTKGIDIGEIRRDRLTKFAMDARHKLYREYLRLVAVHQPAVFVMENVKGILSSKVSKDGASHKVFSQIRTDLSFPWGAIKYEAEFMEAAKFARGPRLNYRLYSFVTDGTGSDISDRDFLVRCEQYGLPQARHRVIVLGIREDISGRPDILRTEDQVRVSDVIGGMPKLRSGLSKQIDTPQSWLGAIRECFPKKLQSQIIDKSVRDRILKVASRKSVKLSRGGLFLRTSVPVVKGGGFLGRWLSDSRVEGVIQHQARSHMATDLGRYLFVAAAAERLKQSPRIPSWPKFLLPQHKNVADYRLAESKSAAMFVDRFKVQMGWRPSSTITSHIAKDGHYFVHPDPLQCRSLTVREAARLQTFPDNYFFCGNRTQQYHQVGNAVPPFLAFKMASTVADFLSKSQVLRMNTEESSSICLVQPNAEALVND